VADEAVVVSNTTPLINLAGVGLLDLLPGLYSSITVAEAVLTEYEAKARADDPDLRAVGWLTVASVAIPEDLAVRLDIGEAATIALALQLQPRLVLLDERRGRRIARERGLPIIGTGAVLVEAKREGLIPAVAPVLDAMIVQGRYISEQLRLTLLQGAGEQP
jgi:hypothetical protein